MELQEFKDDFSKQLQQEQNQIIELNQQLQSHQQQAFKLQGAIEAINLVQQHYPSPVTPDVVDVETIPSNIKRKKTSRDENLEFN
jgi:hypothetical protein